MVTSNDCLKKYGEPVAENPCMILWDVPMSLEIGVIPNRIYCNKDMSPHLTLAFIQILEKGLLPYLKTWDGCFNVRKKRGLSSWSLHSWGIAVDINAFENQLGQEPKMNLRIVQCFKDAGFDWGGDWKRKDGMHFQLSKI